MKQHLRRGLSYLAAAVLAFGCMPIARPAVAIPVQPTPAKFLPLDIKLGKPIQGTVEKDPLQSPLTFPPNFNGKLVYAITINQLPFLRYLVLTQVSHQGKEQVTSVTTYPIEEFSESYNGVSDPQFSPDGQSVLFKWGAGGERTSVFDLYLWNLKTQQLQRVTKEPLGYRFALWSPDSSHIVYIRNGDVEGNALRDALELCVYDLKTGQERPIVKNNGVRNSVSWTPQNTLLFSAFAEEPQPQKKQAAGAKQEPEPDLEPVLRYDTYESSVNGGKPKLIVKNGFQATASPDGKWITCFGSRDPLKLQPLSTEPWKVSRGALLLVMKRDGSERRVFGQTDKTYPSVLWLPDSKGFITLRPLPEAAGAQAQVSRWNIVTPDARKVTLLKATENVKTSRIRTDTDPNFSNLQLSRDATFLLVNVSEIGPFRKGFADVFDSLQAVDLRSGAILKLVQLKSGSILDWHDESSTTTAPMPNTKSNAGNASP